MSSSEGLAHISRPTPSSGVSALHRMPSYIMRPYQVRSPRARPRTRQWSSHAFLLLLLLWTSSGLSDTLHESFILLPTHPSCFCLTCRGGPMRTVRSLLERGSWRMGIARRCFVTSCEERSLRTDLLITRYHALPHSAHYSSLSSSLSRPNYAIGADIQLSSDSQ